MKAKRAAKKAKGRKRDTTTGRYGDGEKAAEKLARRICKIVYGASFGREVVIEQVKAELRAATSVTETAAETLFDGYANKRLIGVGGVTIVCEKESFALPDEGPVVPVRIVLRRSSASPPKRRAKQ